MGRRQRIYLYMGALRSDGLAFYPWISMNHRQLILPLRRVVR